MDTYNIDFVAQQDTTDLSNERSRDVADESGVSAVPEELKGLSTADVLRLVASEELSANDIIGRYPWLHPNTVKLTLRRLDLPFREEVKAKTPKAAGENGGADGASNESAFTDRPRKRRKGEPRQHRLRYYNPETGEYDYDTADLERHERKEIKRNPFHLPARKRIKMLVGMDLTDREIHLLTDADFSLIGEVRGMMAMAAAL